MLLNGPVKTPAALADAERVARHLPGSHVLLRVNPDLPVVTHDHLTTEG